MKPGEIIVVNCSGRGDKDIQELAAWEERQVRDGVDA
jgi:tryptophan synthase beta subunit